MICSNANDKCRPCPHRQGEQPGDEFIVDGKPGITCRDIRKPARRGRIRKIRIHISDMKPGNPPMFSTKEDESRYYRWLTELAREVIKDELA